MKCCRPVINMIVYMLSVRDSTTEEDVPIEDGILSFFDDFRPRNEERVIFCLFSTLLSCCSNEFDEAKNQHNSTIEWWKETIFVICEIIVVNEDETRDKQRMNLTIIKKRREIKQCLLGRKQDFGRREYEKKKTDLKIVCEPTQQHRPTRVKEMLGHIRDTV